MSGQAPEPRTSLTVAVPSLSGSWGGEGMGAAPASCAPPPNTTCCSAINTGKPNMYRRSLPRLVAGGVAAASLPRFAIAQPAGTRVLRFVPQANLTLLDPIFTTAAV